MARRTSIAVSPAQAAALVDKITAIPGVFTISHHPGASIRPPGDIIDVESSNRGVHLLLALLTAEGIARDSSTSISTSELASTVPPESLAIVAKDRSEATWEEMLSDMAKEGNMTVNGILLMVAAGVLAAAGLATSALHLVVGAMLIAPGFEPISRLALGLVNRNLEVRNGVQQILIAYAALLFGAMAATLVIALAGNTPLGSTGSYEPGGVLIQYWTTITPVSLLASTAAGIAGAIVVVANRPVLTAGVMVALALVPTAALAGMSLVQMRFDLAGAAALRWLIDAVVVAAFSYTVFIWKGRTVHKRRMRIAR